MSRSIPDAESVACNDASDETYPDFSFQIVNPAGQSAVACRPFQPLRSAIPPKQQQEQSKEKPQQTQLETSKFDFTISLKAASFSFRGKPPCRTIAKLSSDCWTFKDKKKNDTESDEIQNRNGKAPSVSCTFVSCTGSVDDEHSLKVEWPENSSFRSFPLTLTKSGERFNDANVQVTLYAANAKSNLKFGGRNEPIILCAPFIINLSVSVLLLSRAIRFP
jgi:hypothetical protein